MSAKFMHAALRAAIGAALVAAAQDAMAQSKAPAADAKLETVVVTGSALRRTDAETESPITTLTADQIIKSGLTTVSDVVRSISADNSGTLPTAFGGGFAAGASGVALRGLTVSSTLVLIDGRRAASYALADDGERSFVDLNTIPLDAVERVDVLKDGASALYGADAIAGVVNIILKKSYQGAEVNAEVGKGQHPGGATRRFTASYGVGDLATDRFNAYINVEFQGDDRIMIGDRGYPFNTQDTSAIGGVDGRWGVPGSGSGSISAIVAPSVFAPGTLGNPLLKTTQVGPWQPLSGCAPGTVAASAPSQVGGTDRYCLQNVAPYGNDQPAQQRLGVSTRFTVRVNDNMKAYLNASYFQNVVRVDGRPNNVQSSVSINTNNIALPPTLSDGSLNPNNPFASKGQYALIAYAAGDIQNVETLKNHNFRVVSGVQGDIGPWQYDSAIVVNHTWLDIDQKGYFNGPALLKAVTDGTYNFVDPSKNTAAQRSAIAPDLLKTSTTDMDSIDFRVNRDLTDLPGGPLGIALGVEARYEAQNDPALNPNNEVQGLGIAKTAGSRNVEAAYVEFGLPVLKHLEFNVAGRYDHYSDFGGSFNPKVGFQWKPISELKLRGTFSKGFRAPSFAENGSSSSEGFVTYNPAQSPFPANFCAPTVHSAGYCQPYSVGILSSANSAIQPEKSTSYTFGAVFEPLRNLSASVDFYAIKKTGVIEPPNTGPALNAYLNGQPIPPGYDVIPDIADGSFPKSLARPSVVGGLYANENALKTDGIDIDLRGTLDLGRYGSWTSDLGATKIFSFKIEFPDGTSNQYVGTQAPYILSSGAGTPRYRGSWVNSWTGGPLTTTLSVYYVSGFRSTGVDATGDPNACLYTDAWCHVASFTYADLTGSYKFSDHLTASLAIQNLADRKPPINPADYAGQNYNPTYHQAGIIGRFFKVGVGYKF